MLVYTLIADFICDLLTSFECIPLLCPFGVVVKFDGEGIPAVGDTR